MARETLREAFAKDLAVKAVIWGPSIAGAMLLGPSGLLLGAAASCRPRGIWRSRKQVGRLIRAVGYSHANQRADGNGIHSILRTSSVGTT